jgi:hypothetical protein
MAEKLLYAALHSEKDITSQKKTQSSELKGENTKKTKKQMGDP